MSLSMPFRSAWPNNVETGLPKVFYERLCHYPFFFKIYNLLLILILSVYTGFLNIKFGKIQILFYMLKGFLYVFFIYADVFSS